MNFLKDVETIVCWIIGMLCRDVVAGMVIHGTYYICDRIGKYELPLLVIDMISDWLVIYVCITLTHTNVGMVKVEYLAYV